MVTEPLTSRQVWTLARIVGGAQDGQRVRWLFDETDPIRTRSIVTGTVRSIGDERGAFAGPQDDIREMFLRITGSSGFEHFIPLRDVMGLIDKGLMGEEDS